MTTWINVKRLNRASKKRNINRFNKRKKPKTANANRA